MGFANPQRKHNEFGYTIENGNDLTLTVPELCEEFKLYFNYQWPRIQDDKANTAVGDGEIWKWLDRIKQIDADKDAEILRLRAAIEAAPHDEICVSRGKDPQYPKIPVSCNCWKSKALEEGE